MWGFKKCGGNWHIGFLVALLISVLSVKANPVSESALPLFQPATFVPLALAILLEAVCVRMLLRRWRRPAMFILWLLVMHVFTYPLFLGVLWLSFGLHPAVSVALGEGLIVLMEGGLICLMCRSMAPARSELPVPSLARSVFSSLIGNIASAAAFPLLIMLYGLMGRSIYPVM